MIRQDEQRNFIVVEKTIKLRKWGNGMVMLIPKGYVTQGLLHEGKCYEVSIKVPKDQIEEVNSDGDSSTGTD